MRARSANAYGIEFNAGLIICNNLVKNMELECDENQHLEYLHLQKSPGEVPFRQAS